MARNYYDEGDYERDYQQQMLAARAKETFLKDFHPSQKDILSRDMDIQADGMQRGQMKRGGFDSPKYDFHEEYGTFLDTVTIHEKAPGPNGDSADKSRTELMLFRDGDGKRIVAGRDEFDEKGNKKEVRRFHISGEAKGKEKYRAELEPDGKTPKSVTEFHYDEKGALLGETRKEYRNGQVVALREFDAKGKELPSNPGGVTRNDGPAAPAQPRMVADASGDDARSPAPSRPLPPASALPTENPNRTADIKPGSMRPKADGPVATLATAGALGTRDDVRDTALNVAQDPTDLAAAQELGAATVGRYLTAVFGDKEPDSQQVSADAPAAAAETTPAAKPAAPQFNASKLVGSLLKGVTADNAATVLPEMAKQVVKGVTGDTPGGKPLTWEQIGQRVADTPAAVETNMSVAKAGKDIAALGTSPSPKAVQEAGASTAAALAQMTKNNGNTVLRDQVMSAMPESLRPMAGQMADVMDKAGLSGVIASLGKNLGSATVGQVASGPSGPTQTASAGKSTGAGVGAA